jgi:hypothetical protein
MAEEHHEAWLSNQAEERGFGPLPCQRYESVVDQSAREQSEE